jgi:hypothetical protein
VQSLRSTNIFRDQVEFGRERALKNKIVGGHRDDDDEAAERKREAENIGEPLCRQKNKFTPRRGMKNEQSALRNEVERRKRDNK